MNRTYFWTLWEKARVGWSERTASKHVYYQRSNRSPAQVGCMRQVLRAGALGRPRGIGWRGRWEGGSGWGIHVNPWLIHVNVWQKPVQYCRVISLQLIKINGKKKSSKIGFKSTWTKNLEMFKLDLEKAGEPEVKLPTTVRSQKKQKNFRKNIYFCVTDYTKAFDCADHSKLCKILKRDGNTRPSYLPPEKPKS